MKNIIALSTLLLLATPNLLAGTSSKDWKFEKITVDSIDYCSASTKTQTSDLNAQLTLNIPTSGNDLPTISVSAEAEDISSLKIKALIGKTNKSEAGDLTLIALAPNLETGEQTLELPIWKAENLTDDLISDSTFDLEVIGEEGAGQMLKFSLRGSSKVLKAMAKDCLNIKKLNSPRVLSKLLTNSQNTFIASLNEAKIPVVNDQISLDEFYQESATLKASVQAGILENQDLQIKTADSDEAESILDQITNDLGNKQALNSSLLDEKDQIKSEKSALPREKNQLLRQIDVDQADVPVLRSEYKSSERKYNAAKALSRELTEQMEDIENDISFYQDELNKIQVDIEVKEDQADISFGQLNEAKSDLDRLINNSDINRKQDNLNVLLSALSDARSRLDSFRPRQRIKDRLANNDKFRNARRDARQLATQLEGVKQQISQIRNDIRNKKNQAQAKQQEANQTSNALSTAKSQKPVLEQKKRENLDVAHQILADRKAAHELRQVKTAERKAACNAGTQPLCNQLKRETDQLKRKVDGLDAKAQANINQRQKMEQKIAQYENDINTLGPKVSQLENQASRLNNEANQLDQNRSSLKSEMESIGVRLNQAENTKDRIKDRVSETVWARHSELEDEVNRLDSRSSRLAREIDDFNDDISSLRSLVRSLNREIETLDAEVADLKNDESNTSEDLSSKVAQRDQLANSSEYRTASQKTQRAEAVYDEAKAAFILADNRLRNSLARVTEIENKMDDNVVRLPAIEEELVIVAEDISALEADEKAQSDIVKDLNQEKINAEVSYSKVVDQILSTESLLTNNI